MVNETRINSDRDVDVLNSRELSEVGKYTEASRKIDVGIFITYVVCAADYLQFLISTFSAKRWASLLHYTPSQGRLHLVFFFK